MSLATVEVAKSSNIAVVKYNIHKRMMSVMQSNKMIIILILFTTSIGFTACSNKEDSLNEKLLFKLNTEDIYLSKDAYIIEEEIDFDDGKSSKRNKKPKIVITKNRVKKDLTHFNSEYHYTFANRVFAYHKKKSSIIRLVSKNKTFSYTNQFFVNIKKLFIINNSLVGLMYADEGNYLLAMQAKLFKNQVVLSSAVYYYDLILQEQNLEENKAASISNIEDSKQNQSENNTNQKSDPTNFANKYDSLPSPEKAKDKFLRDPEKDNIKNKTVLLEYPAPDPLEVIAVSIDSKDNLLLAFHNYVVAEISKDNKITYYPIPTTANKKQYVNLSFGKNPGVLYGIEIISKKNTYAGIKLYALNYLKNKVLYSNSFLNKSQYFFGIENKRNVIMIGYNKPNYNKAYFYYYPMNSFTLSRKKVFPNHKFKLAKQFINNGSQVSGIIFTKNFIYFYEWT